MNPHNYIMIMLSMFKSQALNHTLNPMQTHLLKHTQKRLGLRTQTLQIYVRNLV